MFISSALSLSSSPPLSSSLSLYAPSSDTTVSSSLSPASSSASRVVSGAARSLTLSVARRSQTETALSSAVAPTEDQSSVMDSVTYLVDTTTHGSTGTQSGAPSVPNTFSFRTPSLLDSNLALGSVSSSSMSSDCSLNQGVTADTPSALSSACSSATSLAASLGRQTSAGTPSALSSACSSATSLAASHGNPPSAATPSALSSACSSVLSLAASHGHPPSPCTPSALSSTCSSAITLAASHECQTSAAMPSVLSLACSSVLSLADSHGSPPSAGTPSALSSACSSAISLADSHGGPPSAATPSALSLTSRSVDETVSGFFSTAVASLGCELEADTPSTLSSAAETASCYSLRDTLTPTVCPTRSLFSCDSAGQSRDTFDCWINSSATEISNHVSSSRTSLHRLESNIS